MFFLFSVIPVFCLLTQNATASCMEEIRSDPCKCPSWYQEYNSYCCDDTVEVGSVGNMTVKKKTIGCLGCYCLPCYLVGHVVAGLWIMAKATVACCFYCGEAACDLCKKPDTDALAETLVLVGDPPRTARMEDDSDERVNYRPPAGFLTASKFSPGEMFLLSNMYSNGDGMPVDKVIGFEWLKKSAEQGYGTSQVILGLSYMSGEDPDLKKDEVTGLAWLKKAAEQGNPEDQYFFGMMVDGGKGNFTKSGVYWLKKAANQGYPDARDVLRNLRSEELRREFGLTARDIAFDESIQEKKYVRDRLRRNVLEERYKDAEKAEALDMFNLGIKFSAGTMVPKNEEIAYMLYKKAAERGNAKAKDEIMKIHRAIVSEEFDAVERKLREAEEDKKAADRGHAGAQYNLGVHYDSGTGVPKDEAIALYVV